MIERTVLHMIPPMKPSNAQVKKLQKSIPKNCKFLSPPVQPGEFKICCVLKMVITILKAKSCRFSIDFSTENRQKPTKVAKLRTKM